MRVSTVMRPRDVSEAANAVLGLTASAAVVTAIVAGCDPQRAGGVGGALVTVVVVAVVTCGAMLLRRHPHRSQAGWSCFPFLTVVAVVALDLASHDTSVGAQIFLVFPVLYGASQLARGGALLVLFAAVAGEFVVVFTQLNIRDAAVDAVYVSAALAATASLLVATGERRSVLMAELERRAAIDPLTGLVTRRVLDSAGQTALRVAASADGTALILLDLDRFKSINDQHGHPAGDDVLIQLAAILRLHCRTEDVVCRMGGDEIAILLPACSVQTAHHRGEEICAQVRSHSFQLTLELAAHLTVSVGVAHAPTDAADMRTLYAAADHALYVAKRSGRDQVHVAGTRRRQAWTS